MSTLVLLYHSESAARVGINDKTKQRLRAKQMWVNWGHYVGFNGQPFRKWNSYFMKLRRKVMYLKSRNSRRKHANGNSWNSLNTGNFNWSDFNSLTPTWNKNIRWKAILSSQCKIITNQIKWFHPIFDLPRNCIMKGGIHVQAGHLKWP